MRAPIRHRPIADSLREAPGTWGHVGDYPARYNAVSLANHIRTGRLVAYRPAGSFEAEVRPGISRDADPQVWARYVGALAIARGLIPADIATRTRP